MTVKSPQLLALRNTQAVPIAKIPDLSMEDFRGAVVASCRQHRRVAALFGSDTDAGVRLWCVLAGDGEGQVYLGSTRVDGPAFESMTPECPQVHLFERELAEQWGITPIHHPAPMPVRFAAQRSRRRGAEVAVPPASTVGSGDFYRVEGCEVHEVAVGPVHAGVIEPGHFRFQCHGEEVMHLQISLGYQHRGIEEALAGGPHRRTLVQMEAVAGDTTVGHTTAHCQLLEALGKGRVSARSHALRGVALELERLANHVGGLGGIANDVGYLPTSSYCGRLRGDFLNMTALICGNRFGRGLVRPSGVGFDLDEDRTERLLRHLAATERDVKNAIELMWDTPSVLARFEGTGTVSLEVAESLGLVGVAARASGLERDVRQDYPSGIFQLAQIPVSVAPTGDVFARAYVRWLEVQRSCAFVREQLMHLPQGSREASLGPLAPQHLAVSLVEGWRGEVCHVGITDEQGRFAAYKIVDPSFHNWMGLAMALRGQAISDFPLCNKSFDLSYCGCDL